MDRQCITCGEARCDSSSDDVCQWCRAAAKLKPGSVYTLPPMPVQPTLRQRYAMAALPAIIAAAEGSSANRHDIAAEAWRIAGALIEAERQPTEYASRST